MKATRSPALLSYSLEESIFSGHFNIHIPVLPPGHKPSQGTEGVPQIAPACCLFSVKTFHSLCYKWCFIWWTPRHHTWQPKPPSDFLILCCQREHSYPTLKHTTFSLWKTYKLHCLYITVHEHTQTHTHALALLECTPLPLLQTNKTRGLWVIQESYGYVEGVLLPIQWVAMVMLSHL